MIVWQRRIKPVASSTHGFQEGRPRSLCGIATKTSLEVWETQESSAKCLLCEQRAQTLGTKVDRRSERAERERAKRLAEGRKFGGQTGHSPGNEARRYVYKMTAEILRKELAAMKGAFFDGLSNPDDLRQLRYALRTIHAEMVRKSEGRH